MKGLCKSHYTSERMSRIKREINEANVRSCGHCRRMFSGKDRRAIYCSKACKEAAAQARRYPALTRPRVCAYCGATFTSTAPQAITCSKSCSIKWQNQLRAEERRQERRANWEASNPVCGHCSTPISPDKRVGTLYCSKSCKENAHSARWRERSPYYMREYIYGMEPGQFEAILAAQDDRCAICRSEWKNDRDRHVDHDHSCCPAGERTCGKCIRGILCGQCNTGLGQFRDSVDYLRAAIAYLESHTT